MLRPISLTCRSYFRSFAAKPPLLLGRDDCDRQADSITVRLNMYNFYVQTVIRPESGTPVLCLH